MKATIYRKSHLSRLDTADKYVHYRAKRELQVIDAVERGYTTRQAIADALGLTKDHVSKIVNRLVEAEVLYVHRKKIAVTPLEEI